MKAWTASRWKRSIISVEHGRARPPSADFSGRRLDGDQFVAREEGGPEGAHVKDRLELRLLDLVCQGKLPLAEAQHAITTDWIAAYRTYVGPIS